MRMAVHALHVGQTTWVIAALIGLRSSLSRQHQRRQQEKTQVTKDRTGT